MIPKSITICNVPKKNVQENNHVGEGESQSISSRNFDKNPVDAYMQSKEDEKFVTDDNTFPEESCDVASSKSPPKKGNTMK